MNALQNPNRNQLLASLPEIEFERIAPHLELVAMPLGEVLYESGDQLQHVYFPTTAIVSKCYLMENGASSEIVGVGNEGVIGTSLFMGGITQPSRAVVYTGGYGYRIKEKILMEEFDRAGGRRAGSMQQIILRYTQALVTQISQTAVCNRHHTLEQRLCRWLLQTLDRSDTAELSMTQELIASLLGVRREGVTEAAGHLQDEGYIKYRRGRITVLNHAGLEGRACECYAVVKTAFDQGFPQTKNRKISHPTSRPDASAISPKVKNMSGVFTY